ncbi:MAG: putative DNA binding domain-containing protein [Erysipelotrichaceae bacterium]|nr:putative DNA binding domain-containing protein [Erysipelotrichaceae bacterium]
MKIKILDLPLEDEFVEFKTSLSELDSGLAALAAMLNKNGKGHVLYGVANDGEVLGLKGQIGQETIKKIEMRISEIIKPAIVPSIAIEVYEEDRAIIHVQAEGGRRPYSSNGNYRIRVGSSNKKIDPDLLQELFFSSDVSSLEATASLRQDLTFNHLKFLFHNRGLTINEETFELNNGFYTNGKFNMLAELLSDDNNASIKVVRFGGNDKLNMLSRNEYGYKCLLVAMKEAKDYVLSLNETKVDIESGLERKETKLFNPHAFEEAWTNACLHNKWIKNVPPAIYIFNNRIEIISTGGLPFGYSKDDFYRGVSNPINKGLFKIMGQLGLAEQTGHGNQKIIEAYGKDAFEIAESHINVTIPFAFEPSMKQVVLDRLSPTEAKVLLAIKDNPLANKSELAKMCELGTTRIAQITAELKAKGKIRRAGGRKGGYWEII